MADDPLTPLSEAELRSLLEQVDTAIAEGQELRRRIKDAMRERVEHPRWPEMPERRRRVRTPKSRG